MWSDSVRLRHYSFLGIVNVTCPLDINKCPFVHCTNRNVHSLSIRPVDEQKCPLDIQMSIRPLDQQKCTLFTQMSIRPLDKQKCSLDIQMSVRPVEEKKCPLDIQMSICPLDEWTNGHCLMASTLVSNPHGVRLSQTTSLQLPWHCKRYMSIGHK